MILACKDTNLKLVEVLTVADVDDEDQIVLATVCCRFIHILSSRFGQDFEVGC